MSLFKKLKKVGKAAVGAGVGLVVGGPAGAIAGAAAMTKPGKKLLKGAGKIFKKVWDSKIGRIVLLAVAVYFGGAALGYWNTPFAAINGSLANTPLIGANARAAAGAAEAGGAAATGGAGEAGLAGGAAGDTLALGEGAMAASPEVASGATSLGGAATTAAEESLKSYLAEGMANQGGGSIIGKVLSGVGTVGKWAGEHQLITAVGLSGLANALTPSPEEEAERMRRRRVREMNENLSDIGTADLGVRVAQRDPEPSRVAFSEQQAPAPTQNLQAAPQQQLAQAQPVRAVQPQPAFAQSSVAPEQVATPTEPAVPYQDSQGIIAQRLRLGVA